MNCAKLSDGQSDVSKIISVITMPKLQMSPRILSFEPNIRSGEVYRTFLCQEIENICHFQQR